MSDALSVEVAWAQRRAFDGRGGTGSFGRMDAQSGRGLTEAQVQRAVSLSQETYCSVAAMLRASAPVTHEIVLVRPQDDAEALAG